MQCGIKNKMGAEIQLGKGKEDKYRRKMREEGKSQGCQVKPQGLILVLYIPKTEHIHIWISTHNLLIYVSIDWY